MILHFTPKGAAHFIACIDLSKSFPSSLLFFSVFRFFLSLIVSCLLVCLFNVSITAILCGAGKQHNGLRLCEASRPSSSLARTVSISQKGGDLPACYQLVTTSADNRSNKGSPCIITHVCVIMHVKDPQVPVVRVGHQVPLAGFCLSLYDLHALNRDVNMIKKTNKQTNKKSFQS